MLTYSNNLQYLIPNNLTKAKHVLILINLKKIVQYYNFNFLKNLLLLFFLNLNFLIYSKHLVILNLPKPSN